MESTGIEYIISFQTTVILTFSFFIVSFLYASVGMGGGSTYIAIMTLFGVNYLFIPGVSLTLNLVVTAIGIFNFIQADLLFPILFM